jgi:Vitamin K-dependent gamma-carboxylase
MSRSAGAPAPWPPSLSQAIRAYLAEVSGALRGGWARFWFSPADPTTLGAVRICTGLLLLYVHGSSTFELPDLVGPQAVVDAPGVDRLRELTSHVIDGPGAAPRNESLGALSIWFHVRQPAVMWIVQAVFLGAIVAFTLGFWSRTASVLAWTGNVSFLHRTYLMSFGLDAITSMLTLYLMLGPTGRALSLDRLLARRRGGVAPGRPLDPEPSVAANVVIRLIQVHMCIVYLCAGAAKLQGSAWWDGTAVYLTLMTYELAPTDMRWIAGRDWLWQSVSLAGNAFTLAFELGFVFLVWHRLWRPIVLAAALLMHGGIALSMGMGAFSAAMLTGCLAFVPPWVLRSLLATAPPRADDPPVGAADGARGARVRARGRSR